HCSRLAPISRPTSLLKDIFTGVQFTPNKHFFFHSFPFYSFSATLSPPLSASLPLSLSPPPVPLSPPSLSLLSISPFPCLSYCIPVWMRSFVWLKGTLGYKEPERGCWGWQRGLRNRRRRRRRRRGKRDRGDRRRRRKDEEE